MLHLSDDAPERWDITAKNAVLIHAPQRADDPFRLAKNLHETRPVQWIAAERRIDLVLGAPQGAKCFRAEVGQFRMLLHEQEQFKNRLRRMFE